MRLPVSLRRRAYRLARAGRKESSVSTPSRNHDHRVQNQIKGTDEIAAHAEGPGSPFLAPAGYAGRMAEIVAFERSGVRGFLHRPQRPGAAGLVLTHGAGGNCNSP